MKRKKYQDKETGLNKNFLSKKSLKRAKILRRMSYLIRGSGLLFLGAFLSAFFVPGSWINSLSIALSYLMLVPATFFGVKILMRPFLESGATDDEQEQVRNRLFEKYGVSLVKNEVRGNVFYPYLGNSSILGLYTFQKSLSKFSAKFSYTEDGKDVILKDENDKELPTQDEIVESNHSPMFFNSVDSFGFDKEFKESVHEDEVNDAMKFLLADNEDNENAEILASENDTNDVFANVKYS